MGDRVGKYKLGARAGGGGQGQGREPSKGPGAGQYKYRIFFQFHEQIFRSSRSQMFFKIGALKFCNTDVNINAGSGSDFMP